MNDIMKCDCGLQVEVYSGRGMATLDLTRCEVVEKQLKTALQAVEMRKVRNILYDTFILGKPTVCHCDSVE